MVRSGLIELASSLILIGMVNLKDRFFAVQHLKVLCLRFAYRSGWRRSRWRFDLRACAGVRSMTERSGPRTVWTEIRSLACGNPIFPIGDTV